MRASAGCPIALRDASESFHDALKLSGSLGAGPVHEGTAGKRPDSNSLILARAVRPPFVAEDRKGYLFRTSPRRAATDLTDQPMSQPDAWRMIRRRATAAGIAAPIGNHSFRATGITAYLANGGQLEHAQEMAGHESSRTTKLYDRTKERLTQDEVERIRL